MNALKIVLLALAAISVPLLTFFLIRLVLKISRGVDHLNRTLDDARPQLNVLLSNLNQSVEDINGELEKVTTMTGEAQEMLETTEMSLRAVESALSSPAARVGGMIAGFATTTVLFRGIARRMVHRKGRSPGRRGK
ncbi:MAG: DUF948 domain-containing protein [Actinomycetota bacterium]|jgi:uncharacterized protein YoxC|nr:DUF948 domain-containing protein [Actinomycetota bacterium]